MKCKFDTKMIKPKAGDFFVAVRGRNNSSTVYLIASKYEGEVGHRVGTFWLVATHSGSMKYCGHTIQEAVDYFVSQNNNDLNPVTHYFFIKNNEVHLNSEKTFGHTEVDYHVMTMEELSEKMGKIKRKGVAT